MNKFINVTSSLVILFLIQACSGEQESSTPKSSTYSSNNKIYVLGSSTMENMNDGLSKEANKRGYDVINYAKGGEYLYSMCLRIGAFPGNIKFKSSELVSNIKAYIDIDWPKDYSLKTFTVEVNGNIGEVGVDQKGFYFLSQNIKNEKINNDTYYPITSIIPKIKNNSVFIVNLGKNDLLTNSSDSTINNYVTQKSNECINWISQNITKKIIVIGLFTTTKPSNQLIENVNSINNNLNKKYNNSYFDINSYIEGNDIWLDTSITPKKEDLISQKSNAVPMSLSKDNLHLNNNVNKVISIKLINIVNQLNKNE